MRIYHFTLRKIPKQRRSSRPVFHGNWILEKFGCQEPGKYCSQGFRWWRLYMFHNECPISAYSSEPCLEFHFWAMLPKGREIRCWILDSNISRSSDVKFFLSAIIIIYLLNFWEYKLYYTTQLITDATLIHYYYYYYLSYISTCLYSKLIPKNMLERLSQMNPIRPDSLLRRHYVICFLHMYRPTCMCTCVRVYYCQYKFQLFISLRALYSQTFRYLQNLKAN